MTFSAEGMLLAPVSRAEWIAGTVDLMTKRARVFFVPASLQFLADLHGDLGLKLWGLGTTEAEARSALAEKVRAHLEKQLAVKEE